MNINYKIYILYRYLEKNKKKWKINNNLLKIIMIPLISIIMIIINNHTVKISIFKGKVGL